MSAFLVSLDGPAEIPIDRALIVVGRHRGCDVRIDSGKVSRRHCCLALDGDGVLVRDLGSTNGTRINGRPVDVGRLRPGDELAIAEARFRLEVRAASPAAGAASTGDHPAPESSGSLRDDDAGADPARRAP